jgi:hypothetical protein
MYRLENINSCLALISMFLSNVFNSSYIIILFKKQKIPHKNFESKFKKRYIFTIHNSLVVHKHYTGFGAVVVMIVW